MRSARARAAAVCLALALGTPGCGLVDSLTPFGVGTRDYASEVSGENVNGLWAGNTASGGNVSFQVGSDVVSKFILTHVADGCTLEFDAFDITPPVVDGVFTIEKNIDAGGRFVVTGTFTSSTTSSGSYFFNSLTAGSCPTAGTGTFTANRQF